MIELERDRETEGEKWRERASVFLLSLCVYTNIINGMI